MIKNILITSAGRRVSLVRNFQRTVKQFNKSAKVFTTDASPGLSSACQISDGYSKVPVVSDKEYLKVLKKISKTNDISVIVPTIDEELSILAKVKDDFLKDGIFIAVSSSQICDTFYLKDSTEKFFLKHGFDTARTVIDPEKHSYPIFARFNNSSRSVGAQIVHTPRVARQLLSENKTYVFHEFIKGDEFTVDVFIDKRGEVISIVPRKRIEVRSGEVSKALTIKDLSIIKSIRRLCEKLDGAYGAINIQLFKTENSIVFIEVNPRFGGGYPLSLSAGANFAEFLIKDYLCERLHYSEDWQDNTMMLRYDAEVILKRSC